ncbi:MAG: OadG family protein [Clostridia bacterium]|nr:OadG family protein [Clostridia bacterium]
MNTTLLMLDAAATGKVIEFSSWTFADRVSEALSVSLLGLGTTFAVLALLWGVLEIFRFFFYDLPNKRKNGKKTESAPVKPAPAPAPVAAPVVSRAADSDEEIVAAITAAVSLVLDKPATSFRVVSFRRTGTR